MTVFVPSGMIASPDFGFMLQTASQLEFWANEAIIPGLDMATVPVRHWGTGAIEKRPVVPEFGECQIGFYCDAKAQQWSFFKKWMNFINNFDTSYGIQATNTVTPAGPVMPYETTYKEDYLSYLYIQTFSDDGTMVLSIGLNEVYPISMTNIRLDWGQQDQVARFAVAFTYRDWFQTPTLSTEAIGADNSGFFSLL